MLPDANSDHENALVTQGRAILAAYEDMADLIRIGAYRKGSDPKTDEAILLYPEIEKFLSQGIGERSQLEEGYQELASILGNGVDMGSGGPR